MSRANAGKKRGKYSGGCIGSTIHLMSLGIYQHYKATCLEHKNVFLILPSHQSGRAVSLIARTSFTIDLCCHEVAMVDKNLSFEKNFVQFQFRSQHLVRNFCTRNILHTKISQIMVYQNMNPRKLCS